MNREDWLQRATELLRSDLCQAHAPLPKLVRVSCGFPSRGALSSRRRTLGQCWHSETATDGAPQVFVTPLLADGVEALAVLVHELIHASGIKGHRRNFAKVAKALGLEGKPTSTVAGEDCRRRLARVIEEIGEPYPHAALQPSEAAKKQTTRLLKIQCPECGYLARTTAQWLDVGLPTCPCGAVMESV